MRFFLFVTAFVVISFHTYGKKIPGTIISKGESTDVMFEIKMPLMLGEPNFERLQYKVKYYDERGKKITLRPDNVDEIQFRYEGVEIRMISCASTPGIGNIFSSSTRIFLKLEMDGPLRLYRFYYKQTTGAGYGGAPGMTYVADNLIFQKGNGPLKQPRSLGWKKDMLEYFSDCPELRERIESKDLRRKEIEEIVAYYNQKCGKR